MDYNNKVMQVIPLMSAQGVFERRIWPTDELMGWGWEVCSNKECAVGDFSKKKNDNNNCIEPLEVCIVYTILVDSLEEGHHSLFSQLVERCNFFSYKVFFFNNSSKLMGTSCALPS